jgi:hypothetical protein
VSIVCDFVTAPYAVPEFLRSRYSITMAWPARSRPSARARDTDCAHFSRPFNPDFSREDRQGRNDRQNLFSPRCIRARTFQPDPWFSGGRPRQSLCSALEIRAHIPRSAGRSGDAAPDPSCGRVPRGRGRSGVPPQAGRPAGTRPKAGCRPRGSGYPPARVGVGVKRRRGAPQTVNLVTDFRFATLTVDSHAGWPSARMIPAGHSVEWTRRSR